MTATILNLPHNLETLALRIRDDLERRTKSRADWIEATIELCADLAAARAEFPDDIGFGEWFAGSEFDLNKNDRAAAVAMGQDLERAREVLTTTKRQSLKWICAHEFRFPHVGKPTTTEQRQKAFAVYDRRQEAGEELTQAAVGQEAGLNPRGAVIRHVFSAREAANAPELPELSMTSQQKLEAWQRKLEAEFEYRVNQAAMKWVEEARIPIYEKKIKDVEWMLTRRDNKVMTREEYNKVMICLHPDALKSRTEEQLAEAFRIFTHYKPKLVTTTTAEVFSDLPRTREELLARKRRGARAS